MEARRCVWVDPMQDDDGLGYIPSVVIENEDGHRPLIGNGEHSQPWRWGDLDSAVKTAKEMNERLGLTDEDVLAILTSSMAAGDFTWDEVH